MIARPQRVAIRGRSVFGAPIDFYTLIAKYIVAVDLARWQDRPYRFIDRLRNSFLYRSTFLDGSFYLVGGSLTSRLIVAAGLRFHLRDNGLHLRLYA